MDRNARIMFGEGDMTESCMIYIRGQLLLDLLRLYCFEYFVELGGGIILANVEAAADSVAPVLPILEAPLLSGRLNLED
jgi:hypothetical protein